jgi:hypothetical protein
MHSGLPGQQQQQHGSAFAPQQQGHGSAVGWAGAGGHLHIHQQQQQPQLQHGMLAWQDVHHGQGAAQQLKRQGKEQQLAAACGAPDKVSCRWSHQQLPHDGCRGLGLLDLLCASLASMCGRLSPRCTMMYSKTHMLHNTACPSCCWACQQSHGFPASAVLQPTYHTTITPVLLAPGCCLLQLNKLRHLKRHQQPRTSSSGAVSAEPSQAELQPEHSTASNASHPVHGPAGHQGPNSHSSSAASQQHQQQQHSQHAWPSLTGPVPAAAVVSLPAISEAKPAAALGELKRRQLQVLQQHRASAHA